LEAFAEQVSLAMTDARTLEAMHQAHHDTLTGLASRGLFLERPQSALAGRVGSGVALLFVDLDRFKPVNDTLGASGGRRVADRSREAVARVFARRRFGGEVRW